MSPESVDELELRRLVSVQADAINRKDKFVWAASLEDAFVWCPSEGTEFIGKEAAQEAWEQQVMEQDFLLYLMHHGAIQVDEYKASGRWYVTQYSRHEPTDPLRCRVGIFIDLYSHVDGIWLCSRRDFVAVIDDQGKSNQDLLVTPVSPVQA